MLAAATAFASAGTSGSVTTSVFYDSTNANSQTITNGDSFGVIVSADSVFESMTVNLDLLNSNGNIVINILNFYTTSNSYSNHLTVGQSAYLAPGDYILRSTATDESGSTATDELYLKVVSSSANKAPVITSNPITQINEGLAYGYQVTATDADGDSLTYSLTQSSSWLSMNNNGLVSGTAPQVNSDTPYNVMVKVSDGKDFTTQSFAILVKDITVGGDTTAPTITINSPNKNEVYTTGSVLFEIFSNEDLNSAWYSLNGGNNVSLNQITPRDFGLYFPLADGVYSVVFYGRDLAGNIGQSSVVTFYMDKEISDTTPPSITVISPVNGQTYNSPNVLLRITANENLNSAWYKLDGGSNVSMTAFSGADFRLTPAIADGIHTVIFYGRDLAGNTGQSGTITFYIDTSADTTAPIVAITNPVNGQTYTSQRTQMTFTATDNIAVISCQYSLNGGPRISTPCNVPITGIISVQGTNTWTVYATDAAGNAGSTSVTFTVNISSGGGGGGSTGGSGRNNGAKYLSDSGETQQYLDQFAPKTFTEEEQSITQEKTPSSFASLWIWILLALILLLIVLGIIFWMRKGDDGTSF